MNKTLVIVVPAIIVAVVGAAAYMFLPQLSSDQAVANAEISQHVEAARRLLHKFNHNVNRMALLTGSLQSAGVDIPPSDEAIEAIVEKSEDDIDEAMDRAKISPVRRELEEQFLKASFGADWQEHAAPSPRLSAERAVYKSVEFIDDLMNENERLLDEALSSVNQALQVSVGQVDGRDSFAANRLKGMILFHKGQILQHRAHAKRVEAQPYRWAAEYAARRIGRLLAAAQLGEDDSFDQQIAALNKTQADVNERVEQQRRKITEVQTTVDDLAARLDESRTAAGKAREDMGHLENIGADFSESGSFDQFAAEYAEKAQAFRRHSLTAHALEFGTLDNARMDESGDLLKGAYVPMDAAAPIEHVRGLEGHVAHLQFMQLRMEGLQTLANAVEQDIQRIKGAKGDLYESSSEAADAVGDVREDGQDAYEEIVRLISEAEATEEDAVEIFENSADAFRVASQAANRRVGDASSQAGALSDSVAELAPANLVKDDRWLAAQADAHQADVLVAMGNIYYDRFADVGRDSDLLAVVAEPLDLREFDLADLEQRQNEAKEKGEQLAGDAIELLERAEPGLDRHWSVRINLANAYYLRSLFGHQRDAEYAVTLYESAIEGNEDIVFLQDAVKRLGQLKTISR